METLSFNDHKTKVTSKEVIGFIILLFTCPCDSTGGIRMASPWDSVLWTVVVVYCATEILWHTRDGYCILTDIERWLLGIEKPESALQQNFIHRLLTSLTGKSPTPLNSRKMTVIWGRLSLTVCIIRLYSPGF